MEDREMTVLRKLHICLSICACTLFLVTIPVDSHAHDTFSSDFAGIGLGSDYHKGEEASHGGVFVTTRLAEIGLFGYGFIGDVGYLPGPEAIYGRLGGELFLGIYGMRLDAVWESDSTFGVGYSAEFLIPSPYPVALTIGGQSFFDGRTEFVIGLAILLPLNGKGFEW